MVSDTKQIIIIVFVNETFHKLEKGDPDPEKLSLIQSVHIYLRKDRIP